MSRSKEQHHLSVYQIYRRGPAYNIYECPPEYAAAFEKVKYGTAKSTNGWKLKSPPALRRLLSSSKHHTRASEISEKAEKLYDQDSSEHEWRTKLEDLIFEDLLNKRARDSAPNSNDARSGPSILSQYVRSHVQQRHSRPPIWRDESEEMDISFEMSTQLSIADSEQALSRFGDDKHIFTTHKERNLALTDEKEIGQPNRRPDMIVGLSIIDSTPADAYSGGRIDICFSVVQFLQTTLNFNLDPMQVKTESHLVLPFIILEAKSAKGDWPTIERQTAISASRFVDIQMQVQSTCNVEEADRLSIVWVFGNVGPQWKVYGCYPSIEETGFGQSQTRYVSSASESVMFNNRKKVIELCCLDIRLIEDTIRLLEIVETITTWAMQYRNRFCELLKNLYEGFVRPEPLAAVFESQQEEAFDPVGSPPGSTSSKELEITHARDGPAPVYMKWKCNFCSHQNEADDESCGFCLQSDRPGTFVSHTL